MSDFAPPVGMAGLDSAYGAFTYHEMSKGGILIDGSWERDNIVTLRNVCNTGQIIQLHRKVATIFEASLAKAIAAAPLYKIKQLGGFCARHQLHDPKLPLSTHSWGCAWDINWNTNGIGKKAPCDLPEIFVSIMKDDGWTWGGNFRNFDKMHFQYATGV